MYSTREQPSGWSIVKPLGQEKYAMCDYSLHLVDSRPAKVGDQLVVTKFADSHTRGFAAVGEPNVAVCLRPGTEIAFENNVNYERAYLFFLGNLHVEHKVARFRQVDVENQQTHHDALEFPGGEIVLVTRLVAGQTAIVLQLPVFGLGEAQAGAHVKSTGTKAWSNQSGSDVVGKTFPADREGANASIDT